MSEALRKRRLSENHLMETVKHKKIDHHAKENIPPKHYELMKHNSYNTCVQEVKTEVTTPKKNRESLKELPVTPSTNFKLFAAVAADLDYVQCSTPKVSLSFYIHINLIHMHCIIKLVTFITDHKFLLKKNVKHAG